MKTHQGRGLWHGVRGVVVPMAAAVAEAGQHLRGEAVDAAAPAEAGGGAAVQQQHCQQPAERGDTALAGHPEAQTHPKVQSAQTQTHLVQGSTYTRPLGQKFAWASAHLTTQTHPLSYFQTNRRSEKRETMI